MFRDVSSPSTCKHTNVTWWIFESNIIFLQKKAHKSTTVIHFCDYVRYMRLVKKRNVICHVLKDSVSQSNFGTSDSFITEIETISLYFYLLLHFRVLVHGHCYVVIGSFLRNWIVASPHNVSVFCFYRKLTPINQTVDITLHKVIHIKNTSKNRHSRSSTGECHSWTYFRMIRTPSFLPVSLPRSSPDLQI